MEMVENEATKDRKVGGLGPSRKTLAWSDAIDVMSWSIELEIPITQRLDEGYYDGGP